MSCDFKYIAPLIICNLNTPNVFIKDCIQDTTYYLKKLALYKSNNKNPKEFELILLRAGLPEVQKFQDLEICSNHRNQLGYLLVYFLYNIFLECFFLIFIFNY